MGTGGGGWLLLFGSAAKGTALVAGTGAGARIGGGGIEDGSMERERERKGRFEN